MHVAAGDGSRWLVGRKRSCASKSWGGWEREINNSGRPSATTTTVTSEYIGLRLLLLAAGVMAAKAWPPQTNGRRK